MRGVIKGRRHPTHNSSPYQPCLKVEEEKVLNHLRGGHVPGKEKKKAGVNPILKK